MSDEPTIHPELREQFAFLEDLPNDPDQLSLIEQALLIGRFIYTLLGRSVGRFFATFLIVFLAASFPALGLVLWLIDSHLTGTRATVAILAAIVCLPLAAIAAFNFVTYRALRDVVEMLGFGEKIGTAFANLLDKQGRNQIPIPQFRKQLNTFIDDTRQEMAPQSKGWKARGQRIIDWMLLTAVKFTLNRLAKGCVVDGKIDVNQLAGAVGEKADDLLLSYIRRVLWDLTRALLCAGILLVWITFALVSYLIGLLFG